MLPRLLLASLIAAALLAAVVAVRSRDLADPGDGDLAGLRREIDAELDGFTHLERAAAQLVWPDGGDGEQSPVAQTLRGLVWDADRVGGWLAANRAALTHARAALAAPAFQLPERPDDGDGMPDEALPDMMRWQRISKLLALEAHWRARRGEPDASLAAGLDAVALGDRVQTAHGGDLIHPACGIAMKSIGLAAIQETLPHLALAAGDSRAAAGALARYRSDPVAWSRMWASKYRRMKAMLTRTGEGASADGVSGADRIRDFLPEAYLFQPNRTLRLYADRVRALQRESALPCAALEDEAEAMLGGWDALRAIAGRNAVGALVFRVGSSGSRSFHMRRCLSDTALAATQALLGLRAWAAEHGALPDALERLVPRYLREVPRDGFDGAPLRYRREARMLHSPGSDGVDRGGARADGEDFPLEPIWPVPF